MPPQQCRPTVRFGWGDSLCFSSTEAPVQVTRLSLLSRNVIPRAEIARRKATRRGRFPLSPGSIGLGFSISLGGRVCWRHVVDNGKGTRVEVTLQLAADGIE